MKFQLEEIMISKNINKWYRYVFYRKYIWHKKMFGRSDFPQISVLFDMSVVLITYIFAIAILFDFAFDVLIYPLLKPTIVVIYAVIVGWHYFIFVYNKKYVKLEEEFSEEIEELKIRRGWMVIFYSAGSIVLLFILIFLKQQFAS